MGGDEKGDTGERNTADGQVDVEAPSPANMVGESASYERTQDGGQSEARVGEDCSENPMCAKKGNVKRDVSHQSGDSSGKSLG